MGNAPAAISQSDTSCGLVLSFPIVKVDQERREVWGYGTTEALDVQNEIVDYEASKRAFTEWTTKINQATQGKSLGNVREMHGPKAVGKLIAWKPDDERRGIWVGAKISESSDGEDAWKKVNEGVLTGFSIGAPKAERVMETRVGFEKPVMRVIGYNLSELSLVDNPACPESFFAEVKDAGGRMLALAKGGTLDIVTMTNQGVLAPFTEEPEPRGEAPLAKQKGLEANAYVDGDGQVWKNTGAVVKQDLSKEALWKPKTPEQRQWVSDKIAKLIEEGKPRDQAVAIAHSMGREKFEEKKENAMADKAAAVASAELEKGKNIGPVHRPEGKSPGEQTPKVPSVQSPEQKDTPKPSKAAEAGGGVPGDAGETVSVPEGQGKAADGCPEHGPGAGAGPGGPPMQGPGGAPPFPPAAKPMMGPQRYGYCAYCGSKFAEAMGDPAHKECAAAADAAAKEAAAGLTETLVGADGLQKAFIAGIAPLVEAVNKAVAGLEKRFMDELEKIKGQPTAGGPMRTELPHGIRPIEKAAGSGAMGGEEQSVLATLEMAKAAGNVQLADQLSKMAALYEMKRAHGGGR